MNSERCFKEAMPFKTIVKKVEVKSKKRRRRGNTEKQYKEERKSIAIRLTNPKNLKGLEPFELELCEALADYSKIYFTD